LIERLAAIIPPTRFNLIRYHGVLAPNSKVRPHIIPKSKEQQEEEKAVNEYPENETEEQAAAKKRNRLTFAQLLKRLFKIDIEKCKKCGGKLKFRSAITDHSSIKRYLEGTGLKSTPPQPKPAKPPPQHEFEFY